jgi:hypothetical protein
MFPPLYLAAALLLHPPCQSSSSCDRNRRINIISGLGLQAEGRVLVTTTLLLASNTNSDDDDMTPPSSSSNSSKKPQSRLARLAEDWLEEEEDELLQYWERFDEKTKQETVIAVEEEATSSDDSDGEPGPANSTLTTEQRLERYYDRRGIHKSNERKHANKIQAAIATAQAASTPEQAIAALVQVQPYLQSRTQLGGTALLELAIALWQRDGHPDEALCEALLDNPHVKVKVQRLLKQNGTMPPPRQQPSLLWQGLWMFPNNTMEDGW